MSPDRRVVRGQVFNPASRLVARHWVQVDSVVLCVSHAILFLRCRSRRNRRFRRFDRHDRIARVDAAHERTGTRHDAGSRSAGLKRIQRSSRTAACAAFGPLLAYGYRCHILAIRMMHDDMSRAKRARGLRGGALSGSALADRMAMTGSEHGPELVRLIPLLQHASEVDPAALSPLARVEKLL